MIKSLFLVSMLGCSMILHAQNATQRKILNQYIEANNSGTDEAIQKFIDNTYAPDILKKINLVSHINFYKQIYQDFGKLKFEIYEKVEENPDRLVVHLIKQNANILDRNINSAEVLVVEMDLSAAHPGFMANGLGLGALVCEKEKR